MHVKLCCNTGCHYAHNSSAPSHDARMQLAGFKPTKGVWDAVFSVCSAAGTQKWASVLLTAMKAAGCEADEATFDAAVEACVK
jgi:hypothetical protein